MKLENFYIYNLYRSNIKNIVFSVLKRNNKNIVYLKIIKNAIREALLLIIKEKILLIERSVIYVNDCKVCNKLILNVYDYYIIFHNKNEFAMAKIILMEWKISGKLIKTT